MSWLNDLFIEEAKHALNRHAGGEDVEGQTYILVDEEGNEIPAVYTGSEIIFDATENDIREGKTVVTGDGITVGTKEIPNYRAEEGLCMVKVGKQLDIPIYSDMCEYTYLQAIVCGYNTNLDDSVSAEKVVINNEVYNTGSILPLSTVKVDSESQTIKLGTTNDKNVSLVVRYTIIKEDAQYD